MVPNDSISGNWSIWRLRNNIKLKDKYVWYKVQGWQETGSRSLLYRASTVQQNVCPAKTSEQVKTRCTMDTPREVDSSRKAERTETYPTLCPENISPLTCNTWGTKPQKNNVCHGRERSVQLQCSAHARTYPSSPHIHTLRQIVVYT